MSEYEWEVRRVPRTNSAALPGGNPPRAREVAEFLSLEHPGESVGWFLRHHAQSQNGTGPGKRLQKPLVRSPPPSARREPSE